MSLIKREPSPAHAETSRLPDSVEKFEQLLAVLHYATAHRLPSSILLRHYVHETVKTDILNEATILLKTQGRKAQFSLWRSHYVTENRAVTKNESDTKSW
jgi:hypothetical protein